MRVFECKIDYLQQELDSFVDDSRIMSQKDCNIRNYIVSEAYEILESNTQHQKNLTEYPSTSLDEYCIELCHYAQTDGINVQVSWCSELKAWSIGSYNVSTLAASLDDLSKYPGYNKNISEMSKHEIRYNYCHMIGRAWFEILERIHSEHPEVAEEGEKSHFYQVLGS